MDIPTKFLLPLVSHRETNSHPRLSEIISQSDTQYLLELYLRPSFNALIIKGFHIIIILQCHIQGC